MTYESVFIICLFKKLSGVRRRVQYEYGKILTDYNKLILNIVVLNIYSIYNQIYEDLFKGKLS